MNRQMVKAQDQILTWRDAAGPKNINIYTRKHSDFR